MVLFSNILHTKIVFNFVVLLCATKYSMRIFYLLRKKEYKLFWCSKAVRADIKEMTQNSLHLQ